MRRLPRMPADSRNTSLKTLVRELPIHALVPLAFAIFSLFALFGPVVDLLQGGRQSTPVVIRTSVLSGVFALGYAFGALRPKWWVFWSTAAVQVLWVLLQRGGDGRMAMQPPAVGHLKAVGVLAIGLMIFSYTSFLRFIDGTAARYLRVRAEIDLAHEIHQVLVPSIAGRIGEFEFAGFSQPSGEVGGDLVDVVTIEDE